MNGLMGIRRFQSGGSTRDIEAILPSRWETYTADQKIDWFNDNNVSVDELTTAFDWLSEGDLKWMTDNGYVPGSGEPVKLEEEKVGTSEQGKIDYYNDLLMSGLTDQEIRNQAEAAFGKQTDANWNYLKSRALQDYINQEYGGITSDNAEEIVADAVDRNFNNELFAEAIGAEIVKEGDNEYLQFTQGYVGPESVQPTSASTAAAADTTAADTTAAADDEIQPYELDAKAARKTFDVPGVGPVEMFVDEASKRMVVSDEGYWNPNSPVGADLDKVVQWARDQGYQAGVVVSPYASEWFGEDMVAGVNRRMDGATDDQLREYVNAADFVIVDPYVVNEESATEDFQTWMSTFTKNVGEYAESQGKDAWLYLQGFAPKEVGNETVEDYNARLIEENKDLYDQLSFFNMSDFPDFEDNSWAQQINTEKLTDLVEQPTGLSYAGGPRTFTNDEVKNLVANQFGSVTADNFQQVVDSLVGSGVPVEQLASVIGATVTPTEGGFSLSLPVAAAPAPTFTDQQVSDYIAQNFGAVNSGNFSDVINAAYGQGFSPEQIARVTGATLSPTEGGFSFSLPAAAPIEYTDQQISDYIAQNYGTVTAENFQAIVDQAVAENVPIEQLARAIGATLDTNDAGQISLTLPPAAVETQPLSLVDQLKAQQAATGITHQASFSKDQDKIIADMADKLGKYGVQDLTDLKPITGEIEYRLDERMDDGEPTGVFNLMQLGIGPEGEEQWQYAGRVATPDEINQIRTKGTVTENVGVLNSRTGEEIPVNKLNNAAGSGFTYYKIEFSPDGIAVPYGYKEATGAGALGDQIKSIVSIPPIAAALAAVTAGAVGPEGLQLVASKPVAAAIGAGTVGYAASGRLDTAAKAAATAFTVSYALQALGVDLNANQAARVDAVSDLPEYSSLTRTVDFGNGLSYDPVGNQFINTVDGTITNAVTGEVGFTGAQNVIYNPKTNEYIVDNPDGTTNYYNAQTGEVTTEGAGTSRVPTLAELNAKVFGDEFTGTEYGEGSSAATGADTTATVKSPTTTTKADVVVTGTPATGVFNLLPVGTVITNPINGNPAQITIAANGTKQITDIASAVGTVGGIQALGPGSTAQVNVDAVRQGTDQSGAAAGAAGAVQNVSGGNTAQVNVDAIRQGTDQGGAAAGAVQNLGGNTAQVNVTGTKTDTGSLGSGLTGYEFVTNPITGNTEVVKVTGTKTGTDQGAAAAGATATTKGPLSTGTTKITEGRFTELTSDEIEALLKAGFTATLLLGGGADSPTIPTTNVDIEGINTRRPGFDVDLNPTIPPGSTTVTKPGQTVYTNLGINTGKPTSPTTPTTGIGSLPVPTYKPPPFLGAQAPGASRITPPVLTADPTFTQADFDFAAADIARQQAALPPIVQQPPATPFESGLAKGTTVAKRAGGIVALRGGGIPLFQMGGPVAFAYGGMTAPVNEPRMLSGGGDGMSDSIPATINGTQPARLADGEFVIPADVVSDIGNGSSKAGAKELYAMMDRVRQSRHGTTKQPPEVNMNKVLPV